MGLAPRRVPLIPSPTVGDAAGQGQHHAKCCTDHIERTTTRPVVGAVLGVSGSMTRLQSTSTDQYVYIYALIVFESSSIEYVFYSGGYETPRAVGH